MVNMDAFRDERGEMDWQALKKAEIANGSRCYLCGSYSIFSNGRRSLCRDCRMLRDSPEEVYHPELLRCPRCGCQWSPWRDEDCEVFADGDHLVTCLECEHEFMISTMVSYTFTSPARTRKTEVKQDANTMG